MRKISLLTGLLLLSLSLGVGPIGILSGSYGVKVLAQEAELPDPGLTPDSPFYFLERISEEIGTFFTFGDLKKAERYAVLATERVAEVQALVAKGKPEAVERALKGYEDQLDRSLVQAAKAKVRGIKIEKVTQTLAEATGKHLTALEGVSGKVPEKVKEKITKAKEASMTGQKNALRALAGENPERATEINLRAVEARLNRAKAKIEGGEVEEAEEVLKEFENQQKFGEEISLIARGLGKDTTTIEQLVAKATARQVEIFSDVYNKAPEKAREVIKEAMTVSETGRQKAVKVLIEKGALGGIPETAPVLLPLEVRERVREKVKEGVEKGIIQPKAPGTIEKVPEQERERTIERSERVEKILSEASIFKGMKRENIIDFSLEGKELGEHKITRTIGGEEVAIIILVKPRGIIDITIWSMPKNADRVGIIIWTAPNPEKINIKVTNLPQGRVGTKIEKISGDEVGIIIQCLDR